MAGTVRCERRGKSGGWDWGAVYHVATVDWGRSDDQFWRMTVAQLSALSGAGSGPAVVEPEEGSLGDLMMMSKMRAG